MTAQSDRTDTQLATVWQAADLENLIRVGGNQPTLLNDPDTVWIIYSGKVDVFAVELDNGQAAGMRRHLFRAEADQALFGMQAEQQHKLSLLIPLEEQRDIGLLASGVPGTQLIKLSRTRLKELAQDPTHKAEVIRLVEHWVSGLCSGIAQAVPPRQSAALLPGEETALAQAQVAMLERGVVWVKHQAGASHFMSKTELSLDCADGLVPLSPLTWLESIGGAILRAVDTETWLSLDPAWSSLERFHRLILDCTASNLRQIERAERSRLRSKAELDHRVMRNALTRLASVLGQPKVSSASAAAPALAADERGESLSGLMPDEPLLVACRWVGRALGLTIQPPVGLKETKPEDLLNSIARASRIRIRKVALRGDWWRQDNSPLLACIGDYKHPVALLPTSVRSYKLHDAIESTSTPVTAEVAATLAPFAYSFYRPFPEQTLTVWQLLAFGFQGCHRDLAMVVLMGLAGGLLGLLVPLATGVIFDNIIPSAQGSQLVLVCLALIVSAFASAMFQLTRSIATLRIEGRAGAFIQAAVWDRLLSLPTPFFRNYAAGDLADRAMGINTIRHILSGTATLTILASVFSVFNLGLLFFYDAHLAWAAILLVVILIIATTLASYLQVRHQRSLVQMQGRISGLLLQFITGISKLRVAGAESRAFGFWAREFSAQKSQAYKARNIANGLAVVNAVFPILTTAAIFAIVASAGDRRLSTGSFLAFTAAFSQFLYAGLQVTSALLATLNIIPVYERARPILQTLPEADQAKGEPGELTGEIQVDHVSFRYKEDGPLVLQEVVLHIRPGEFVALVGPSGSGKSTLLRLLLGFETPRSGAIFYDGQDLAGLDVRAVRRQLGVVLQHGRLMAGSLLTNIVGASSLTIEDAWEAVRLAGLAHDIEQMPMGMHTVISEGGGTLSGGQRQRLLIARAIVNKPRILFFDEATSSLDNATQAMVSESLEHLRATRVVIAHRLSTIAQADRIIVMDAGRVIQSGTYAELVKQPGLFAGLVKRQLA